MANNMIRYPLETVTEGKTKILVPDIESIKKPTSTFPPKDAPVFYNKKMELNRDFALATLRVFQILADIEEIRYCEPMAGSGIRSVRVANEIDNIKVIINDLNPHAVELIEENVDYLKLEDKVEVYQEDANSLVLNYKVKGGRCHVIDLDPFGSPAQFVDAMAQAINNGGLLAITSTDMATMCGVYPSACIRKYASKPIHTSIGHEISVRMLIGYIAFALARHGKSCIPVFSHSTAHYIRVYVKVEKGITKAKTSLENIGFISHCLTCLTIDFSKGLINKLSRECPICKEKRIIGGPYWVGKIFDEKFVVELNLELERNEMLYGTITPMKRILAMVNEEVKANESERAMICFYDLHEIADKLNIPSPKLDETIKLLTKNGFVATRTHFRTNSIKTDAPVKEVISAMKLVLERS